MDLIGYLLSWLSYRVVAVCFASVPLTHVFGLYCRQPPSWRPQHLLLFPLTGGNRHIIFQLLAWGLWGLSALAVLPVLSPATVLPLVPRSHVDVISGAAAACSFIGELFMVKALLVYDESESKHAHKRTFKSKHQPRRQRPCRPSLSPLRPTLPFPPPPCSSCRPLRGSFSPSDSTPIAPSHPTPTSSLHLLSSQRQKHPPTPPEHTPQPPNPPPRCLLHPTPAVHEVAPLPHTSKHRPQTTKPTPLPSTLQLLSSPEVASLLVMGMGLLMSITGGLLLMSIEYMPDIPSRVLYCCLSLSCLLIASSSTYGLGGFLRFVKARPSSPSDPTSQAPGWQFFQPFAGGTAFVATQAVGWSLFSATIVAVLVLVQKLVLGVAACLRCWAVTVGVLMILAQMTLGVSVLTYQHRQSAKHMIHHPSTALHALQQLAGRHLPVLLMYLPVHSFFLAWTLTFTFLPLRLAVSVWVALLLPYYAVTLRGDPGHTGCRRWDWLCEWFTRNVEGSLTTYFGELKVVRDSTSGATPATDTTTDAASDEAARQKYIFAFQPHGYYPTGAGFLPMMPSFKRLFPGITPVTLTASVMYVAPAIKDICCWAGFRQVARKTFIKALNDAGAVVMCPGGQAEMVHAHRTFRRKDPELVLHVRHKGFCRIAIEQGAAVVPVLALGEILQLRNAIDAPTLQQYTYRRLGFPFPYLMTGRWGFSPVPRKVPLHYIIGDPLAPPPHNPGEDVSAAVLDEYHGRYVESLKGMWDRHKDGHPLLKDARLALIAD